MISFPCPQCGITLSVEDSLSGKTQECHACGEMLRIPKAEVTAKKEENHSNGAVQNASHSKADQKAKTDVAATDNIGIKTTILAIVGTIVFTVWLLRDSGPSYQSTTSAGHTEERVIDRKYSVIARGQAIIKELLKSPGSAEFPGILDDPIVVTQKDGCDYYESWVDSQNAFGALIRTKYKFWATGAGDHVTAKRLDILSDDGWGTVYQAE